jgi:dTDP-4-dehydrorhamnose 3,5-epimerase
MERIHKLDRFLDSRGWSLNDIFRLFEGEEFQINYSVLHPGVIKAWHRHKYQDDYFCVLKGNAQVGIFSEVPSADGKLKGPEKHFIGEHNPAVVRVKAGEWHGLTAIGCEPVGLLYLVTRKYDPESPDEERAGWENFGPEGFWFPENK